MEMTKQRKLLITVAGLGLGLLAVDRFVLSSPDSASADQAAAPMPEPTATAPVQTVADQAANETAAQATLPSFEALTERLAEASSQHRFERRPDPFSMPPDWETVTKTELTVQAPNTSWSGKALLEQYKLTGTFRSVNQQQEELIATVNGNFMRVGDRVKVLKDGARSDPSGVFEVYILAEVGVRSAVWESVATGRRVVMDAPNVLE